ncbi:MAG: ATP-binding cassette domain-containing protein [Anaeroplasmataceae bacterium]|nr:ATP-binding cassette domain-containing protein [Anaeroplasmataceae bacterium]
MKFNDITLELKSGRKIVKNLTFTLNNNDKLAIIGEEGNGKSTLLKYVYDKNLIENYCYFSGVKDISKEQIGYLEQSLNTSWSFYGALDYILTPNVGEDPEYELYNTIYQIETLFKTYNLNLSILSENQIIQTLSGGEKIKLQLIKILIRNPELILLDEPTNDIDLDTILLLENFIKTTSTPIIFVSHDEELLSNTANTILHLEQIKRKTEMKFTYLKTDYSSYIELRSRALIQQNKDAYRTRKEKEDKRQNLMHQHLLVENDLDRAVRQPGWGSILAKKMKNIKAMEKKLEKMPIVDYAQPEEAINVFFSSDVRFPNGKTLIEIKNLTLSIENRILISSIHLKLVGPKHICFIGKNGCGKTTLMRHIYQELKKRTDIRLGYMPQSYEDELSLDLTPVEYLQTFMGYDKEIKGRIMSCLAAMNFQDFEMENKIQDLSGGQKAKLFLIKMILLEYNVLLLDEPTRNLSPLSNPVIRNILKNYKGAIIAVSHDRKFLKEVAEEIYELNETGLYLKTESM